MPARTERKDKSKGFSRKHEIIALVLLGLGILAFLSLVSSKPDDLPPNSYTWGNKHNWIGFVGAHLADKLFSLVGTAAYFIPFMLVVAAWGYFRAERVFSSIVKIVSYALFISSTAGLLRLFYSDGGIIGKLLGEVILRSLVGNVGAIIVLFVLMISSFLLITNITFSMIFERLGMTFESLSFNGWLTRYRAWRDEQDMLARKRLEKRRKDHIEENEGGTLNIAGVDAKSTGTTALVDGKRNPIVTDKTQNEETTLEVGSATKQQTEEPEESRPKIVFNDESSPNATGAESVPTLSKDEGHNIPITPIKATGELEELKSKELTEFEIPEDEDASPKSERSEAVNWDHYVLPTTEFLTPAPPRIDQKDDEFFKVAKELVEKTGEFNVTGTVKHICQGPVVTTYEFKPDAGVKYSKITSLSDDLCLALKAESVRIDRIPGKAVVGIEVPNQNRETIYLRKVIESEKFQNSSSLLSIALGKSIDGLNYVADLTKMPHLLMAGQTGAGKSVGINGLIVSILYKARPDEVKFIMVDPKQVELGIYADIPHLATPIIKDPKRASFALKWAVGQMETRYRELAAWGVRNIDGYNAEVKRRNDTGQLDDNGEPWKKLPYLVIIIDELADLMMVAGKEVEESIARLAQMARAVGIHLVLATQRPSVDVITGLIKANFPSRISFRVSSKVDSRTIIDANGAESLLGKGDMLFLPPGTSNLVRVHGAFVDEKEIAKIVDHIKAQGKPEYDVTITKTEEELDDSGDLPGKKDPLFLDALRSVVSAKRGSTSLLQRHLRIGYGRAAAILDAMVKEGFIGEMDGSTRARPVLEKAYEFLEGYDSADKS